MIYTSIYVRFRSSLIQNHKMRYNIFHAILQYRHVLRQRFFLWSALAKYQYRILIIDDKILLLYRRTDSYRTFQSKIFDIS